MGEDLAAFLARHVATLNVAVARGDFAPLVALFAKDARLEFAGVPVGPFEGRAAIADAYRARPPADTMTIPDTWTEPEPDGTVVETFSWSADDGSRSGEMPLRVGRGRIQELVVSFG